MTYQRYIGIDPDVSASGVAVWIPKGKQLFVNTLEFWELLEFLESAFKQPITTLVVVEGGWLNKVANFHNRPGQTKRAGESIARNVGRNHQVGLQIVDYVKKIGLPFEVKQPKKTKTKPEVFERMTKIKTTNKEIIDATMLVFGRG